MKKQAALVQRNRQGMIVGIIGFLANTALAIAKLAIGLMANSQAIIADGINSLGDTLSSAITVLGFYYASKPADTEHPYGHERVEHIAGFMMALIIAYLGIDVLRTSIQTIRTPQALNVSQVTLTILILSIAVKIIMALYYYQKARKLKSDMLRAATLDAMTDILVTTVIGVALLVQTQFGFNIDGYLGVVLAVFIIYSALMMLRDFINDLLGKRPSEAMLGSIRTILEADPVLLGYHDLLVHDYGNHNVYASVHVEMDEKMSLTAAHSHLDYLERKVAQETGIVLVTHVDPLDIDSQEMRTLYRLIKMYLKNTCPDVSFHDLRVIDKRLSFDIVLGNTENKDAIISDLEALVQAQHPEYEVAITIDTQQLI